MRCFLYKIPIMSLRYLNLHSYEAIACDPSMSFLRLMSCSGEMVEQLSSLAISSHLLLCLSGFLISGTSGRHVRLPLIRLCCSSFSMVRIPFSGSPVTVNVGLLNRRQLLIYFLKLGLQSSAAIARGREAEWIRTTSPSLSALQPQSITHHR